MTVLSGFKGEGLYPSSKKIDCNVATWVAGKRCSRAKNQRLGFNEPHILDSCGRSNKREKAYTKSVSVLP